MIYYDIIYLIDISNVFDVKDEIENETDFFSTYVNDKLTEYVILIGVVDCVGLIDSNISTIDNNKIKLFENWFIKVNG